MKVRFSGNVLFPHSWLARQRYLGRWERTERRRRRTERQSYIQNQPHVWLSRVTIVRDYKQTIIYQAVTRVCFENSIIACGPGLGQICQQCWSVPKVLVAAAKKNPNRCKPTWYIIVKTNDLVVASWTFQKIEGQRKGFLSITHSCDAVSRM